MAEPGNTQVNTMMLRLHGHHCKDNISKCSWDKKAPILQRTFSSVILGIKIVYDIIKLSLKCIPNDPIYKKLSLL